ncbi:MAG TPA: DNRLRE domain-containing protein [Actinomycetota bacterium]|nr:DNRLRE domain-containing protein [Actinomycetota bacterium]
MTALALAAPAASSPSGAVATQSLRPAADTFVVETKSSTNMGAKSVLKLDAKPVTRSYLRFDVAPSDPIAGATLRVYSPSASAAGVSVHPVADTAWDERSVTYSNAPAFGAPVATSGPLPAGGWTSVDVSSLVSGPGPVSLALTTPTKVAFSIGSRESVSTAPQLELATSLPTDLEPPTVPGELSAVATGATRVQLIWGASTDDVGVAGYDVFRDGQLVGSVAGSVLAFTDTDLEPEHTYAYGVEAFDAAEGRSSRAGPVSVTTPAASADPVIVAVGDIACDPAAGAFNGGLGVGAECRQMATSDLALSLEPTRVLALGDLQYACGGYDAFLQSYDPSWGRLRAITHPVPGNHEYLSAAGSATGTGCSALADASGYFAYFGAAAGHPSQGWYSFDVGTWHVIALNSNCGKIGGCSTNSPQGVWLRNDLGANDAACTLAFWHHPRFSSGPHGNTTRMDKFWALLDGEGAEVVLAGHDHLYERFARLDPLQQPDPEGMRSFVVGTGGKEQYLAAATQPGSEVRIDDRYGVLELTLSDGSYGWRFMSTSEPTALDAGAESCH